MSNKLDVSQKATMKGVSPSSSKLESPKTPGGISKSLLTPCRRVGLSRKWKKGGCSPFISPLSTQNSTPENKDDIVSKKRKKCEVENVPETNDMSTSAISTPDSSGNSNKVNNITATPCRNTQIPRKKSKTLMLSPKNDKDSDSQKNSKTVMEVELHDTKDNVSKVNPISRNISKEIKNKLVAEEKVSKLTKQTSHDNISNMVRTESKSKIKLSLKRSNSSSNAEQNVPKTPESSKSKEKSPNTLTKECIVVIQNKFFKSDKIKVSQESDSEADIPLSLLRKENTENVTLSRQNDDDFICRPSKEVSQKKNIRNLSMIKPANHIKSNNASQSSQDDIDRRTILIKKSYVKVTKPSKAKSTGSITQKDIDELKARIEKKKKLLMAKSMSIDTEELRELIKKWQRGCQDALIELLDLMKKKLPDQQNMNYAEILETLKIPTELVGYDSENDCFLTPDDTNILLSTLKL